MTRPDIKENHWQGSYEDQSFVEVNHYNERGLNLNYFWRKWFTKPSPTNEDMEVARLEACQTFLKLAGRVIITVVDSGQIPENDRNSSIDMREGHKRVIGTDAMGLNIYAKKQTGDTGDQYYDWKQETDYNRRVRKVRQMQKLEKRKNGNNGHHPR